MTLTWRDCDQVIEPKLQLYHSVRDVQDLVDVRSDFRDLYGFSLDEGRLVTVVLEFSVLKQTHGASFRYRSSIYIME